MKPKETANQPESDPPYPEKKFTQQHNSEIQDDRLAKAIRDLQQGLDPSASFETQLMLEGLLSRLEQARILPLVENPNPYDPSQNMDEHDQWWETHPEEAMKFDVQIDKRNEALRCLYIGSLIGSGPWNIP